MSVVKEMQETNMDLDWLISSQGFCLHKWIDSIDSLIIWVELANII